VGKVNGGAELGALAGELGVAAANAADITRSNPRPDLPRAVVTRVFATPVGKAADAAYRDRACGVQGDGRERPPLVTSTQQASAVEEQLRQALAEDVLAQFMAEIEKQIGVRTYPENMRRAIGGES
jgi:peptidyl-prolyl cis-trans isomerase D